MGNVLEAVALTPGVGIVAAIALTIGFALGWVNRGKEDGKR